MLMHFTGLDGDIEIVKVNVQADHVHMVIAPGVSVAGVVKYMKSKTGKALKEK